MNKTKKHRKLRKQDSSDLSSSDSDSSKTLIIKARDAIKEEVTEKETTPYQIILKNNGKVSGNSA